MLAKRFAAWLYSSARIEILVFSVSIWAAIASAWARSVVVGVADDEVADRLVNDIASATAAVARAARLASTLERGAALHRWSAVRRAAKGRRRVCTLRGTVAAPTQLCNHCQRRSWSHSVSLR